MLDGPSAISSIVALVIIDIIYHIDNQSKWPKCYYFQMILHNYTLIYYL